MSDVNEALFIKLGMCKDGWKKIDVDLIQAFIDEPWRLDDELDDFVECYFKYFDWYWENQRGN